MHLFRCAGAADISAMPLVQVAEILGMSCDNPMTEQSDPVHADGLFKWMGLVDEPLGHHVSERLFKALAASLLPRNRVEMVSACCRCRLAAAGLPALFWAIPRW